MIKCDPLPRRSPRSRCRIRRTLLSIVGAGLAATGVAACGSEQLFPPGRGAAIGGFAGYAWAGKVTSVNASWRVPGIVSGPREAVAATWVGVQGPSNAFIQIGTNEQRTPGRHDSPSEDGYFAFWSDPQHGYHPLRLFEVQPGDEITARIALVEGVWHLALSDASTHRHAHFAAASDGSSPAMFALWIQENAIDEGTGRRFPYPRLRPIRFGDVLVDSHQPSGARLESQFMSLPGRYLGPTRLASDSFVVRRAPMTRRAATYLRIADAGESAREAFLTRLLAWSSATPQRDVSQACATLSHTIEHELRALRAHRWPAKARGALALLSRRLRFLLGHVRVTPPGAALLAWRFDYEGEQLSIETANDAVQRVLGLPSVKGVIAR